MSAAMKSRPGRSGLNRSRTQSLKSQASLADLQTSEDVAFAQWVTVWQSVMKRSLAQMDRTRGKRPPTAREIEMPAVITDQQRQKKF